MKKAVLVTGASSGIGLAICHYLLNEGYFVFGSVRSREDAAKLQKQLGHSFHPLVFDVTDVEAIQKAAVIMKDQLGNQPLYGLVNNAGIAVAGPLELIPLADIRKQFEVNVIGQMAVIQTMIPLLESHEKKQAGGRIVNISSVSGLFSGPFIGPYSASKFALEALTDSLRRELLVKGIDVISICPGSVQTPIWDKAESEDFRPYLDSPYAKPLVKFRKYALTKGFKGLHPIKIAQIVHKALSARKPKARYVISKSAFLEKYLLPVLPKRLIDAILKTGFALKRK